MQATKPEVALWPDVKFSNISRSLCEGQALIKTEDRLSRNLDDEDFTEVINREICRLGGWKVLDNMVIALNPGDIRKCYARRWSICVGFVMVVSVNWVRGIGCVSVWRLILSISG